MKKLIISLFCLAIAPLYQNNEQVVPGVPNHVLGGALLGASLNTYRMLCLGTHPKAAKPFSNFFRSFSRNPLTDQEAIESVYYDSMCALPTAGLIALGARAASIYEVPLLSFLQTTNSDLFRKGVTAAYSCAASLAATSLLTKMIAKNELKKRATTTVEKTVIAVDTVQLP